MTHKSEVERRRLVAAYNDLLRAYDTSLNAAGRNALLLWRALALVHRAGEPVPKSLLDRFCEYGDRLELSMRRRGATSNDFARALQLCAGAAGMTAAERADAALRRWKIAQEVSRRWKRSAKGESPPKDVLEAVALQFGTTTPAEVRKYFYRLIDRRPEVDPFPTWPTGRSKRR